MIGRPWTPDDNDTLRDLYPNNTAKACADVLCRSLASIYAKAKELGLSKSDAFYTTQASGRDVTKRGTSTRFLPGQRPWNYGKKGWESGGRSTETRFKKGCMSGTAQHNYKPIGTYRISKDGYLEQKTTDDQTLMPARRWTFVHRLVWISHRGDIPPGHVVVFRSRRPICTVNDITIDKLELITRAQLMAENTRHKMPDEVKYLITLRSALTRRINKTERKSREKQNAGCA